ncbi:MAG: polyprenyl synthetase family protein [Anaerolineae bacterium]
MSHSSSPATSQPSTALALVAADLAAVEAKMRGNEQDIFPPLAEAFLSLITSGGKRLRPLLALLAARLFAPMSNQAIALAAAVETLHTATLVHDDVIDNALIRRGNPTLNASWTSGATVLAGDYLFARAAAFAAETGNVRVITLFAETLKVICEGELRQLAARYRWDQPKDAYYERIYAKTASLFAAATEGGAVLGAAREEDVERLRAFGYHLGMAFQIIDDILDFTSTDAVLGKPAGSDLHQGTVTLPVFYFIQDAPDRGALLAQLEAWAAADGHTSTLDLVAHIAQSNAIARAYDEAASFIAEAVAALQPLPASDTRNALLEIATATLGRHR